MTFSAINIGLAARYGYAPVPVGFALGGRLMMLSTLFDQSP